MIRSNSSCTRLLAAALLAGASLLSIAPAHGSIVDWVVAVDVKQPLGGQPGIVVSSNGQKYTSVTDSQVELRGRATGRCRSTTRVARSTLYIDRLKTGGSWTLYNYYNHGLADNRKDWDKTDEKNVSLNSAERQAALDACNKMLSERMKAGMTRRQVLSQDRLATISPLFKLRHYFVCQGQLTNPDHETATEFMINPVMCKGFDFPPPAGQGPHPGGIQVPFQVTSAKIDVDPEQSSVVTQAHLTVSGEVAANGAGDVKIRVSHNGKPGPLTTLSLGSPGKTQFHFPLTIPCPPSGSGGSGGPASGGGPVLAGAPSNQVNGHLEFRVVSPPSPVKKSNKAFYKVTCKPTPTVAGPTPDLVVSLKHGTRTALVAEVRNVGSGASGATQLKVVYPTGSTTYLPVPALGAGKSVEIPVSYPPSAGSDAEYANTEVIVDQPSVVQELNENNNSSKKKG